MIVCKEVYTCIYISYLHYFRMVICTYSTSSIYFKTYVRHSTSKLMVHCNVLMIISFDTHEVDVLDSRPKCEPLIPAFTGVTYFNKDLSQENNHSPFSK